MTELLFRAWQPIKCENGHVVFLSTAPQVKFRADRWSETRAKLIPIGNNLKEDCTWTCRCGGATFHVLKGYSGLAYQG